MAIGGIGFEAAHRNAVITCGAMGASTVLYAAVVVAVSISQAPFEGSAGLIGIVRRTLLARSRARDVSVQARRLVRTAVITSALAEVPAILGLVFFMLSGLRGDFHARFALSIALQALYFPRLDGWREWAAEPAPGC